MFVIMMLNSNDEWELCRWVFDSREAAESFAADHFDVFEDTMVQELEKYQ